MSASRVPRPAGLPERPAQSAPRHWTPRQRQTPRSRYNQTRRHVQGLHNAYHGSNASWFTRISNPRPPHHTLAGRAQHNGRMHGQSHGNHTAHSQHDRTHGQPHGDVAHFHQHQAYGQPFGSQAPPFHQHSTYSQPSGGQAPHHHQHHLYGQPFGGQGPHSYQHYAGGQFGHPFHYHAYSSQAPNPYQYLTYGQPYGSQASHHQPYSSHAAHAQQGYTFYPQSGFTPFTYVDYTAHNGLLSGQNYTGPSLSAHAAFQQSSYTLPQAAHVGPKQPAPSQRTAQDMVSLLFDEFTPSREAGGASLSQYAESPELQSAVPAINVGPSANSARVASSDPDKAAGGDHAAPDLPRSAQPSRGSSSRAYSGRAKTPSTRQATVGSPGPSHSRRGSRGRGHCRGSSRGSHRGRGAASSANPAASTAEGDTRHDASGFGPGTHDEAHGRADCHNNRASQDKLSYMPCACSHCGERNRSVMIYLVDSDGTDINDVPHHIKLGLGTLLGAIESVYHVRSRSGYIVRYVDAGDAAGASNVSADAT